MDRVVLFGDEAFHALRRRHGLPEPDRVEDFPVHRAYVDGAARPSA